MKQITALLYLLKSIFQTFVCTYTEVVHSFGPHLLLVLHNTRDVHVHVQCHYILYMYMYNAITYCTCTCAITYCMCIYICIHIILYEVPESVTLLTMYMFTHKMYSTLLLLSRAHNKTGSFILLLY